MAFFISRKKLQNIRPTNNGFTISQRKARHQRLAFCVLARVITERHQSYIQTMAAVLRAQRLTAPGFCKLA
ncbi:hypothetical protein LEP1GSC067_0345 [Leptospira interrogans serovar Lora str. TE 1992]|uniref:Uncharacterized protein n=1 Tax=Leptospira interrogans serovar Lora str. TE 1992 TaxID=1193028 RepID=M3ETV3_LEPIR|nr:hypothetical protein LEP1GSC067_0345 [Leptospira interrogans serovar Lora str. TE 1992]EMN08772.1 hypothetical protein LEP1GSC053_2373 [Leptospira interrogans serovar Muenchen str. Brem 129]